jgi:hypothetical protein
MNQGSRVQGGKEYLDGGLGVHTRLRGDGPLSSTRLIVVCLTHFWRQHLVSDFAT